MRHGAWWGMKLDKLDILRLIGKGDLGKVPEGDWD